MGTRSSGCRRRRGSALLVALVVLLVLTLALVALFTLSRGGRRQVAKLKEDAGFAAAAEAMILRELTFVKDRGWARRAYLGDPELEGRFGAYETWRRAEDLLKDGLPLPNQSLFWLSVQRGETRRGYVAWIQFREPTALRPRAWRWIRFFSTLRDLREQGVRDAVRARLMADRASFVVERARGLPASRAAEAAAGDAPLAILPLMRGALGLSSSEGSYWTKLEEGDRAMARGAFDEAATAYEASFAAVSSYGDVHGAATHPRIWLRQARCLVARSDGEGLTVARSQLDQAWELCQRILDRYEGHCLCPVAAGLAIQVAARSRVTDPDRMAQALDAFEKLAVAHPDGRAQDEDLSIEEMKNHLAELWTPKLAIVGRHKEGRFAEIYLASVADPSRLQSMTPLPLEDCYAVRWLGGGSRLLALVNTETDLGVPKLVGRVYERDGRRVSSDQLWLQYRMIWSSPSGRRLGSADSGADLAYWTIPGNLSERRAEIPTYSGVGTRPYWPGLVWSADETRMYYLDRPGGGNSQLLAVNDGSTASPAAVSPPSHYVLSPHLAPSGDIFYLSLPTETSTPQATVMRLPAGGGSPVSIATVSAPFTQRLDNESSIQCHLAPTGDRMLLVFGGRMPEDDCCKVLDLDSGSDHLVFQGRGWPYDPSWGPKGRKFYCTFGSWEGGMDVVEVDGETGDSRVFVSSFTHPSRGGQVNCLSVDVSE